MKTEYLNIRVTIDSKEAAIARLNELVSEGEFTVLSVSKVINSIYESIGVSTCPGIGGG